MKKKSISVACSLIILLYAVLEIVQTCFLQQLSATTYRISPLTMLYAVFVIPLFYIAVGLLMSLALLKEQQTSPLHKCSLIASLLLILLYLLAVIAAFAEVQSALLTKIYMLPVTLPCIFILPGLLLGYGSSPKSKE